MENLHPIERTALEELHRAEWIAQKESRKEYGRILEAWMKNHGDGILRNWYLTRLDQALRVENESAEWKKLNRLFKPIRDDLDLFRTVVQLESEQLALDGNGNWLVPSQIAVEIAETRLERESAERSVLKNWLAILALLLGLAVLSRCS